MTRDTLTTTLTITFPEGLIGCEDWRNFELEPDPEAAPLLLLNSLDDPELAFIIADPRLFDPNYAPQLSDADLAALGNPAAEEMAVMVIITPPTKMNPPGQPGDGAEAQPLVTVNLLGPLFLNLKQGVGRQVLQSDYNAHVQVGGGVLC